MNYYAGIGSRDTPDHILNIMHHIGAYLATQGWILRSGAAGGADSAFEEGCKRAQGEMEIYLPWADFNHSKSPLHPGNYPFTDQERAFTASHHPAWNKCSPSMRLMHQRNTRQIVGLEALHGSVVRASSFVVCWTDRGLMKGGTSQALRIAVDLNIPIVNLGLAKSADELTALVQHVDDLNNKLRGHKIIG